MGLSSAEKTSPLPFVNVLIQPVNSARNLGVIVTNDLNMDVGLYINNLCRSASFTLNKIGRIRYLLDEKSTETLVHTFIYCHLDMCNGVLYSLPDSHISKLQRSQNSAARLVTRTRFSDHITPVLRDLHWLPVKFRIMYKIPLLTYKCLHGLPPEYLSDLIQEYKPVRNLAHLLNKILFHHQFLLPYIDIALFIMHLLNFGMNYHSTLRTLELIINSSLFKNLSI